MSGIAKVAGPALPVVAGIQAARAALDAASEPESVQDVRARLRVLREVCAAAMRDPNVSPEDVAHARRECEQLALEAAVKLGSMVPAPGPGARTDAGTSATAAEVAKRCGLSERTLYSYRDLAAAFRERATEFMDIAREAINTGAAVPLGRLIALVKPEKPKAEKPPAPPPTKPDPPAPARDQRPAAPAEPEKPLTSAQEKARADAARVTATLAAEKAKPEPMVDEIRGIGRDCDEIVSHLQEARRIFDEMVPHPLPPVRIGGNMRSAPRDECLAKLAGFFDAVDAVVPTVREIASMDGDAIRALREARDKKRRVS